MTSSMLQNEYRPDIVSPPGETLLETLETIGMSQAELAKSMDNPVKTISEIIQGETAITAEIASRLEHVLHIPASFWLKREQQYRESLDRIAEEPCLASWVKWLRQLPLREMERRGWILSCTYESRQVLEVLRFFGVTSPDEWKTAWEQKVIVYRQSTAVESNFGAAVTWLRQGEVEAQEIETALYNADAFRDALKQIRNLTVEPVSFFRAN